MNNSLLSFFFLFIPIYYRTHLTHKKYEKINLKLSTSFDNAIIKNNNNSNDNSALQNLNVDRKNRRNINYNILNDDENEINDQILNLQENLLIKNKNNNLNCLKLKLKEETEEKEKLLSKLAVEQNNLVKIKEINFKNEEMINKLNEELIQTKVSSKNYETIQKQINEMSTNQDKVNSIFGELGKLKEENKQKVDFLENLNKEINAKLAKSQIDHENLKKQTNLTTNTLKNENSKLLTLIQIKENEIGSINKDKHTLTDNSHTNETDLKNEILNLKTEFQSTILSLSINYEKTLEKTKRSRCRLDKLVKSYENHINFLIERFKYHVTDLIHAINNLKIGNKTISDSPFINDRILKNIENFTSLLNEISQVEIFFILERSCD